MELDGFQIHVGTETNFDRTKTKAHLAYEVKDLQTWREKLASRGMKILEGVKIPNYERFEFRDPFDNRVEFLKNRKPTCQNKCFSGIYHLPFTIYH